MALADELSRVMLHSLIRHAKARFAGHRLRHLVLAKFLPGVNLLAAGLAGTLQIRPDRFLLYAATGALLWAGIWITLGYLCADVIGLIAKGAARLGTPLVIVVAAAFIAYVVFEDVERYRFLGHLRKARITPIELWRRLEAGDQLVIVDVRTALDIEATPPGIPGAQRIPPEALDDPHQHIQKDSEVVFYGAEPREATSVRMALLLDAHGYRKVHPLSGGLASWRQAGFAVEPLRVELSRPVTVR